MLPHLAAASLGAFATGGAIVTASMFLTRYDWRYRLVLPGVVIAAAGFVGLVATALVVAFP